MVHRAETLPAVNTGELRLRALYSGVSRGTERLVLDGAVPPSEYDRMRAPFQAGAFPFPVKYGYCFVGRVEDGPAQRRGQVCFALHPHQSQAVLPTDAALSLPPDLPPRRAVLAANMETALTVLWDSGAGAGDRVLTVGGGTLGLLIAALAARLPAAEVTVVDTNPARRRLAQALGAGFALPADAPTEQDVAINASASAAGLRLALASAGLEARVVEASWHGDREVALPLGEAFHAKRLHLVSSQVGRIPSARAPRWSHRRRLATALRLLAGMPALDRLITHEIAFADAPTRLPPLLAADADALTVVLAYD